MKKLSFLFVSMAFLLCFSSCTTEKKQEPQEPQQPCKFNKQTIDIVVNSNDWKFDNQTGQFFYHQDIEELTSNVYNYAEVSVSREYNSKTANAYQVALPETSYHIEYVEEDGETYSVYYQQHVDYIYGVGWIEIFFTISDFYYPSDFIPESMIFRMQLTY